MGMFDSVYVDCPWCKKENELQTKMGACLLRTYSLNENAMTTMGVLGVHTCYKCEKEFEIKMVSQPMAIIKKYVENETD